MATKTAITQIPLAFVDSGKEVPLMAEALRTGIWQPMPEPSERKRIYITAPPDYEMKLLTALSFFLGRKVATQAAAALAMYIRQSHDRILTQCEYYAHQWGMKDKWEVLDLIYNDPERAEELMKGESRIHKDAPDVFSEGSEED